ncbi:MAG: hypothetical protein LBM25_05025 [Bacteroidales bacterium]|jgi:hypothetical protein|nr:hypothetical protein [Bacteroidales bacterium]
MKKQGCLFVLAAFLISLSFIVSIFNTFLVFTMEDRLNKKIEYKFFYEKSVNDFIRNNTTLDNPNPVDSVHSKNDTILFFKEGKLIGSIINQARNEKGEGYVGNTIMTIKNEE